MSVSSTSPSVLFGGTWEKIEGKFIMSSSSSYSAGTTGGSNDAVVVSHTHTGTADSDGSHTHTTKANMHSHIASISLDGDHSHNTAQSGYSFVTTNGNFGYESSGGSTAPAPSSKSSDTSIDGGHRHRINVGGNTHSHDVNSGGEHSHTLSIDSAGSNGTGKNMPEFISVNVWKRMA